MSLKYKVVNSFSGTIYSKHSSLEAAEKSAEKVRKSLDHPNCGSLGAYVNVVPINASFTNIIPHNKHGVFQVSQKLWI